MHENLTKREIADRLLRDLFTNQSRLPIAKIVEAGREIDVSRRTLTRAAADLGLREIHNGPYGAFWEKTV